MAELLTRKADTDDTATIAGPGLVAFTETFGHLFGDPGDLETYPVKTFSEEKIRTAWFPYYKRTVPL